MNSIKNNNISKRIKDKEIRWKQPFANAKMEDIIEIIQAVNFENQYFRQLLIDKGILAEGEFEKFVMDRINIQRKGEQIIENSEIVPEEVTI